MESKKRPSIHSMEVAQENKLEKEEQRRSTLNDKELRVDLEKQYGKTNWARKLINRIVSRREFR